MLNSAIYYVAVFISKKDTQYEWFILVRPKRLLYTLYVCLCRTVFKVFRISCKMKVQRGFRKN